MIRRDRECGRADAAIRRLVSRAATMLGMSLLVAGFAVAEPLTHAPLKARPGIPPPIVHLTWDAPYGARRARVAKTVACRDTMRNDTLWLTFETPRTIHQLSVSGVLVFEPTAGDSLGEFWQLERGGANQGNLLVDFDLPNGEYTTSPWHGLVNGHVGFTREGRRGRLDLSANGPAARNTTEPNRQYFFARVTIQERRAGLRGCRQPISIRWVAARFPTLMEGDLLAMPSSGRSVSWNAGPGGIARSRPLLAVETWTPVESPPSRHVLEVPRDGQPRVSITKLEPAPSRPDTSFKTR